MALRQAHVELEERLEELKRLAELKDFLANTLVHDMRTPMTAALGSLGMMEHELNVGGQRVREYLGRAQVAMTNVINMATDVIELARLEESESFAKLLTVDVAPIVRERVKALEDAAKMRGQTILICTGDEPMQARIDSQLTGRILDNLLMNAIHHAPSRSSIEVGVRQESEGDILVSVQNGGLGIPREYHQKIFEKYGQIEVHSGGVNAGVGLGLAFCRLAVQAQGGRIWVESEESLTRFCFTLPSGQSETLTGTVA
jgi:signal transduction histidine kinase